MAQFSLVQQYSETKRDEGTDEFRKKLLAIVSSAHLSLAIALGHELDLFQALAVAGNSQEPASAIDVSRVGDLKARYVHEWLCCMACGEVIECDPSGQMFWIPDDRVRVLTGEERNGALGLLQNALVPLYGGMLREVANLYRKSGPSGISHSHYKALYAALDPYAQELYQQHLVKELMPRVGVVNRLRMGIKVLDIGCGTGHQLLQLAQEFPQSHFTGIDICADAIRQAQQQLALVIASQQLQQSAATTTGDMLRDRVDFIVADAASLDATWTGRFDLVLMFDSCRDMPRPDQAITEAFRCLDMSGLSQFAMVEMNSTGNCHADRHLLGRERAALLYAQSVLHTLPMGSHGDDALQLGTMFGVERGKLLLESAGFKEVSAECLSPFMEGSVLYKAWK